MRIRDWSLAVCSSDLSKARIWLWPVRALSFCAVVRMAFAARWIPLRSREPLNKARCSSLRAACSGVELHTDHDPVGRSVKLLIRKGRKERKGERQEHPSLGVGSTASRLEPTYNSAVSQVGSKAEDVAPTASCCVS